MNYKLKKDIIIPAGTVLKPAPTKTLRTGHGHIQADIGLTSNTSGTFGYCLEFDLPEEEAKKLGEFFEAIK